MREEILEKVKKYIAQYQMLPRGSYVVAGVSGGADSVCLLHLLWRLAPEYQWKLEAVHINHGVREDAGEDAEFVQELCRKLGIPCILREVAMEEYARSNGLSPEEAGRVLRYKIFEETLERSDETAKTGRIAVAHNANDRAETMLFHMFRGSGLKGMCSIPAVRGQIVRPILCLTREEIEAYLDRQGLLHCEDSTNSEDAYARNRIRHHILPYAEEQLCRGATAHMGELADILCETETYLEQETVRACERCVRKEKDSFQIELGAFRKEAPFLQKRVFLSVLEQLTPYRKDITGRHIENLCELAGKEGCKEIRLPYQLCARKEYDRIFLEKITEKEETLQTGETQTPEFETRLMKREEFFSIIGENIPEKRYTKWFDYDKITTSLQLRTRQPGDYLTIDAALHRKSLKEYMINEKIPKWQRDHMQVLVDGSHIVWVPGYRISQYYKVEENTERILEVRLRGGKDGREN